MGTTAGNPIIAAGSTLLGKAAGVIEAKKAGTTLSGVADQAARYLGELPSHVAKWADQLPFDGSTVSPLNKVSRTTIGP